MNRKLFIKNNNFSVVIDYILYIPQYSRNVDIKMYVKVIWEQRKMPVRFSLLALV